MNSKTDNPIFSQLNLLLDGTDNMKTLSVETSYQYEGHRHTLLLFKSRDICSSSKDSQEGARQKPCMGPMLSRCWIRLDMCGRPEKGPVRPHTHRRRAKNYRDRLASAGGGGRPVDSRLRCGLSLFDTPRPSTSKLPRIPTAKICSA